MKRMRTRKKVSAHRRGEHIGNMAHPGCPLCKESYEKAKADTEQVFADARRELGIDS